MKIVNKKEFYELEGNVVCFCMGENAKESIYFIHNKNDEQNEYVSRLYPFVKDGEIIDLEMLGFMPITEEILVLDREDVIKLCVKLLQMVK